MQGEAVSRRSGVSPLALASVIALFACLAGWAVALDEPAAEREALKGCEKQICQMIVNKEAAGKDLSCALSKTWTKTKIKEGIERKQLSWGFGDARCSVDVAVKREAVVGAMTKADHAVEFAPHKVNCEVEREGDLTRISVTLAPKLTFKEGKAQKAYLNVKEIDAPTVIKGAIWTVAQIESNFGLFHGDMISEINEFIGQKCPKALAAGN